MGDKRENRIKSWEDTLNGSVRELEKTHILARGRGGHQLRNIFRDFPKKIYFPKKNFFQKKTKKNLYSRLPTPVPLKECHLGFRSKKSGNPWGGGSLL